MITLNKSTIEQLMRWGQAHPEIEVVGMVWGKPDGSQKVVPLSNVHKEPSKYYATDVVELQQVFADMAEDETLLAFYHSHPSGRHDPSEADMEGALNLGIHYLILYPEITHLYSGDKSQSAIQHKKWCVSAWECIDMGILVGADVLEAPR